MGHVRRQGVLSPRVNTAPVSEARFSALAGSYTFICWSQSVISYLFSLDLTSLLVSCLTCALKPVFLHVLAEFVLTLQSDFHQASFGLSFSFGRFSSLPSLLTVTVT